MSKELRMSWGMSVNNLVGQSGRVESVKAGRIGLGWSSRVEMSLVELDGVESGRSISQMLQSVTLVIRPISQSSQSTELIDRTPSCVWDPRSFTNLNRIRYYKPDTISEFLVVFRRRQQLHAVFYNEVSSDPCYFYCTELTC